MKLLKAILTILLSLILAACGTANIETAKPQPPEAEKATKSTTVAIASGHESAKISGSFSGTIIDFYPDYVADDVTIKKALIQIPQQGLFLLNIDKNLNPEQIEKNSKSYRFTIQEYDLKDDQLSVVLNNKDFFSRAGCSTLLSMFSKEIVIDAVEEDADNSWENNVKILIE